ncbi:MAG: nicotinate-nicotinamide nucleotide adenylyltransferase, partial [Proteobacteria bacterium]|nr:nicotinate-nicotinamide nucleotide adenylyltransferase [Pseudomonadota bacterium]
MNRVGVFGGTFDPPHLGHLGLARIVLDSRMVQEVWFIPCLTHRFRKKPASYEDRVAMCRLLVKSEPHMKVSTVETRTDKPGYTLAMIERLITENPQADFRHLAGTDIYHEKDKWFHYDKIERLAPPIYVERKGVPPIPHTTLSGPMEVSSRELRRQLAQGE